MIGCRPDRRAGALLLAASVVLPLGCASTGRGAVGDGPDVMPLMAAAPDDLTALYDLRIPESGGLRLLVRQRTDGGGRASVSEPFGSLVSVTDWAADGTGTVRDYRAGCRAPLEAVAPTLGVGSVPLPEAVRLLTGRLPRDAEVEPLAADRVGLSGEGWGAEVRLRPAPWRPVEIVDRDRRWSIDLSAYTPAFPGRVRVEHRDGRWLELALRQAGWGALPPLGEPDPLPPCPTS